jgi:hypothetical protein
VGLEQAALDQLVDQRADPAALLLGPCDQARDVVADR